MQIFGCNQASVHIVIKETEALYIMTYDAHSCAGKESNLIESVFLQKDSILQIWLIGYHCFRKNINER